MKELMIVVLCLYTCIYVCVMFPKEHTRRMPKIRNKRVRNSNCSRINTFILGFVKRTLFATLKIRERGIS